MLHETRVSGTAMWSPTNANSPTYRGSGNRGSDFRVSGGPPVYTVRLLHYVLTKVKT